MKIIHVILSFAAIYINFSASPAFSATVSPSQSSEIVQTMATNRGDAFIVRSTIDLAHNLKLQVVAEGVEDEHTMNELAELGCNVAQGFHIGRPVPAQEFAQWLAARGVVATTARDVA